MITAVTYAVYIVVAIILVCIAISDIRTQTIPNKSVLALAATWVLWRVILIAFSAFFTDDASVIEGTLSGLLASILFGGAAFLFSVLYERTTEKYSMGGGDIKLIAALALFLGFEGSALAVLFACLLSLAASFIMRVRSFPFAPFLAVGSILAFAL